MYQSIKRHWIRPVLAILALVLASAVACGAASNNEKGKKNKPLEPTQYNPNLSLAPLVEKVAPAVVNIKATAKVRGNPNIFGPNDLFEFFFGPRGGRPDIYRDRRAVGSGFIIDKSGLVVTNHHVVSEADEIEVQLADDRTFKAELVGSDERTDVALLRLKDAKKLPTVPFGDSDVLRVGDHVVAIGNPFGLDHTVTSGIVSAKERVIGAGPYDDFIQTDASINPGNSGGPLFNLSGEVVGINTAIAPQGQGIGFAIPSNMAITVIDSLSGSGKVVRGWLGVLFQPLDEDLAKAFGIKDKGGAVVSNVTEGSPADKGGMKTGDVIVAVNGKKLKEGRQLPSMVAKIKPGSKAKIEIIREGKKKTLTIKVGQMPDDLDSVGKPQSSEKHETDLGIVVQDLDDQMRSQTGIEGVLVTEVKPDSKAAGFLRRGDIVMEVNRDPVSNVSEFKEKTKNLKTGDDVLLLVYQRGGYRYLTFRL